MFPKLSLNLISRLGPDSKTRPNNASKTQPNSDSKTRPNYASNTQLISDSKTRPNYYPKTQPNSDSNTRPNYLSLYIYFSLFLFPAVSLYLSLLSLSFYPYL